LGFDPGNRGSVLEKHQLKCRSPVLPPPPAKAAKAAAASPQHPTHRKNMCHKFNATKISLCHEKPSIAATMTFFTTVNAIEIYN
jgi:hypothetical protein